MGILSKLKAKATQLKKDVKGTYGEFAAGKTAKNLKALLAKKLAKDKRKKKKKRVDIYARGQKRKAAMEAAGNLKAK